MGFPRAHSKTSPMERKWRSFVGNSTDAKGGVLEKQRGRLQVKGGGSTAGFGPKGRARSSSLRYSLNISRTQAGGRKIQEKFHRWAATPGGGRLRKREKKFSKMFGVGEMSGTQEGGRKIRKNYSFGPQPQEGGVLRDRDKQRLKSFGVG